jgi:hypothetical protein
MCTLVKKGVNAHAGKKRGKYAHCLKEGNEHNDKKWGNAHTGKKWKMRTLVKSGKCAHW